MSSLLAGQADVSGLGGRHIHALYRKSTVPPCFSNGTGTDPTKCYYAGSPAIDLAANTLGVKFSTSEPIKIVGVRFWKNQMDQQDVQLWLASGVNIGGQVRRNSSTSVAVPGWQDVFFEKRFLWDKDQDLMASYLAPSGNYAFDHTGFSSAFVVRSVTVFPPSLLGGGFYSPGAQRNKQTNKQQSKSKRIKRTQAGTHRTHPKRKRAISNQTNE